MLVIPIRKVDEKRQLIYGRAIDETPDLSGEVFDYASSKEHMLAWSAATAAATNGGSLGNLRSMHGSTCAGKLVDLQCDDHAKAVDITVKVVDPVEWQKVLENCYVGFSLGGRYLRRWADTVDGQVVTRYTAVPTEISLVDKPCVPSAKFYEIHKRDGSVRRVAFQRNEDTSMFTPRDENHCGRSTAASLIKATLANPSGDLVNAFGKRDSGLTRRQERILQGVSPHLQKRLAKAGIKVKGPTSVGFNGAEGSSIDAIKAIHSQGARKMAPTSLPPQSDNAAPAPRATRADVTPQGQYATPGYSAPPLFGATAHAASESSPNPPPQDSDVYRNDSQGLARSFGEIQRIHRGGAKRMWET